MSRTISLGKFSGQTKQKELQLDDGDCNKKTKQTEDGWLEVGGDLMVGLHRQSQKQFKCLFVVVSSAGGKTPKKHADSLPCFSSYSESSSEYLSASLAVINGKAGGKGGKKGEGEEGVRVLVVSESDLSNVLNKECNDFLKKVDLVVFPSPFSKKVFSSALDVTLPFLESSKSPAIWTFPTSEEEFKSHLTKNKDIEYKAFLKAEDGDKSTSLLSTPSQRSNLIDLMFSEFLKGKHDVVFDKERPLKKSKNEYHSAKSQGSLFKSVFKGKKSDKGDKGSDKEDGKGDKGDKNDRSSRPGEKTQKKPIPEAGRASMKNSQAGTREGRSGEKPDDELAERAKRKGKTYSTVYANCTAELPKEVQKIVINAEIPFELADEYWNILKQCLRFSKHINVKEKKGSSSLGANAQSGGSSTGVVVERKKQGRPTETRSRSPSTVLKEFGKMISDKEDSQATDIMENCGKTPLKEEEEDLEWSDQVAKGGENIEKGEKKGEEGEDKELLVQNRVVSPLYKQLFYIPRPTLAFIGLPWRVCPFPLFHYQASYLASVLTSSSPLSLPSREEMEEDMKREKEGIKNEGLPEKYGHMLGEKQWKYFDELIELREKVEKRKGEGEVEKREKERGGVRNKMYDHCSYKRRADPLTYRKTVYTEKDGEFEAREGS